MEICNKQYVFVINNTIIKKGKVIFQVSTKDINYGKLNKLSKIKTGYFKNVRFDIDGQTLTYQPCGQCSENMCIDWQNIGYVCPNETVFNTGCGACCSSNNGECIAP